MSFGAGIGLGGVEDGPPSSEWRSSWGSGWGYSHDWDLEIDNSGDIRTSSGIDELRKDIAFRGAIFLQQISGESMTPSNQAKAEALVDDALSVEPRVDSIKSVSVERSDTNSNRLLVETRIIANDRELNVIFEV